MSGPQDGILRTPEGTIARNDEVFKKDRKAVVVYMYPRSCIVDQEEQSLVSIRPTPYTTPFEYLSSAFVCHTLPSITLSYILAA